MSKVLIIATACHALNAAIAAAIGEEAVAWADAPKEIQASTMAGVEYHLANPDVTPEQSHEAWLKYRTDNGWTLGEIKDVEAKTHPNMVPFDQLPLGQRMKDHVFRAAVHALKDLPLEQIEQAAAAVAPPSIQTTQVLAPKGFVPIRYVGRRASYRDGLYGTGIVFEQGQTLPVPADAAHKMLRHPDVYVLGEIQEAEAQDTSQAQAALKTEAEKDKVEEILQEHRDAVMRMDTKNALEAFAKQHFGRDLDKRMKVSDLQAQVIGLIDQYGVPAA